MTQKAMPAIFDFTNVKECEILTLVDPSKGFMVALFLCSTETEYVCGTDRGEVMFDKRTNLLVDDEDPGFIVSTKFPENSRERARLFIEIGDAVRSSLVDPKTKEVMRSFLHRSDKVTPGEVFAPPAPRAALRT